MRLGFGHNHVLFFMADAAYVALQVGQWSGPTQGGRSFFCGLRGIRRLPLHNGSAFNGRPGYGAVLESPGTVPPGRSFAVRG
jgi:hypothetical protein